MRYLVLLSALLLFALPSWSQTSRPKSPTIHDVKAYGAVGDGSTDDAAAFRAAVDAACDGNTPRQVYIPTGSYRVGDITNTTFHYLIPVTCSDITIYGDGPENTELLVGNAEGYYMFYACSSVAFNVRGSCDTQLTNITFRDFKITDDDPEAHGHGYYIMGNEGLSGGTPAHGDDVSWNSGTEDGTVESYNVGGDTYIRIMPDDAAVDTLEEDDDITDGVWSTTNSTLIASPADDEGHGIGTRNVKTVTVDNVHIADISDEGLDFTLGTEDFLVKDLRATGCSQVGAGGACISVQADSSGVIQGGYLEGGARSAVGTGGLIAIENNNSGEDPVEAVTITGTIMVELDAAAADRIESGLKITANAGDINGVNVSGVHIEVDHTTGDAIIVLGSGTDVADLNVTGSTIIGTTNVEPAANASLAGNRLTMSTTVTSAHQGWDAVTANVMDADNAQTILVLDTEGAVATGNAFGVSANDCVRVANNRVSVQGNTFDTCGGGNSLGHHAVLEDNSLDESIVNDNIYFNNPTCGEFYVGDGTAGVNLDDMCLNHASKGSGTYCLGNIVETPCP